MMEILLYNIVFWTIYIGFCNMMINAAQYVIDNYEIFFEKSEKDA